MIYTERILRHLASGDIVKETGLGQFAPNAVTKLLATPEAAGMSLTGESHKTCLFVSPSSSFPLKIVQWRAH
jgi:hypothetical protein